MKTPSYCLLCAAPLVVQQHGGEDRLACEREECGFVYWDNPKPVVAGVLELDGEIVLVRNQGWPEKWFGLVTGFLERGETPEEGILREIKEELNIDGDVVELIGLYPFEQTNEIIIAYYVRGTGEVTLNEELEAFKLFAPQKLRPWPFGTGLAVRDWLRRYQPDSPHLES